MSLKLLKITASVSIKLEEIELEAVRSQGSGGQNVNKIASSIHLRFDVNASSLPPLLKERLLALADSRLTKDGVIVIKAQQHRTQERNREAAILRLKDLIKSVTVTPKPRKPTKPSKGSIKKRLDGKTRRGQVKALRVSSKKASETT